MKKFLVVYILLVMAGVSGAQVSRLLINENFTNYTNGNLNTLSEGQGSWKPSYPNSSSDFVQVNNSAPLVYSDYTGGEQYINVVQKEDYVAASSSQYPDDPYKIFKEGIIPVGTDSTTFYISFLVRVPSAAGVQSTGNARPNIALRNVNGSVFANFYIAVTDDGSRLKFGVGKDAFVNGTFGPATYNFNTTYLVVIRYDINNNAASADYDDKMYMWINPSLSAEPSVSTAQAAIDNFWDFNFDGGFNSPAQSIELFQEANSATASFDGFKVSYGQGFGTIAANAAAAWAALSPAEVALPFKFKKIKGYPEGTGILLEWNVLSEFKVTGYQIQRSTDGVSFSDAGEVIAEGGEGNYSYKWFDRFPAAGHNYYRVKNIDSTQEPVYSTVVRVDAKEQGALFSVYPNPVRGHHLSILAGGIQQGGLAVTLFNAAGQEVYKKKFSTTGGAVIESIELPPALLPGIYVIELAGVNFKQVKQLQVL